MPNERISSRGKVAQFYASDQGCPTFLGGEKRWHGPALLQPGPPGGNKKPPGLFMLNHKLFSGP